MKIIVLGNGFDLASGLKTRFSDFFEERIRKKHEYFTLLESSLRMEFQSSCQGEYNSIVNHLNTKPLTQQPQSKVIYEKRLDDLNRRFREKLNLDVMNSLSLMQERLGNIRSHSIGFWDVYFYALRSMKVNPSNWNDFEEHIRFFVDLNSSDKDKNKINFQSVRFSDDINNHSIDGSKYDEESINDIFIMIDYNDKVNFVLKKFIELDNINFDKDDIYAYLLDELKKLEDHFKNYISDSVMKVVNSDKANQKIYRDNFIKLINDESESEYHLINFNYSTFSNAKQDLANNLLTFSRDHKELKVFEVNVHGRHDKNIIFGVDQSEIEAKDASYQFSKTYRKLELSEELESFSLPSNERDIIDVNEIIFYGHSLSNADYSYFQSIFDYYNIYSSKIKIRFMYSQHDGYSETQIKSMNINRISKLLHKYGNSLGNDWRGKNLIHKLMLENRLITKQIALKKIEQNGSQNFEKRPIYD